MKNVLMLLVLTLTSSLSHATETTSKFAALSMLKTFIEMAAEDTTDLASAVKANADDYRSLRFYQLSEKSRVGRQNCGDIRSTNTTHALMIYTLLEQQGDMLKQIPELNTQYGLKKLSRITDYLHAAKSANDTCSVPTKSWPYVKAAAVAITEVHAFLQTIKNEIPQ